MAAKTFGRFFKELRLRSGQSLRGFCLNHRLDPGNISKLERGLMAPPQSREKLEYYASCLQLSEGSDEWYEFFDLAFGEIGRIPPDILSDAELMRKLPLVFRTIRGQKVTEEKLDELAELVRRT